MFRDTVKSLLEGANEGKELLSEGIVIAKNSDKIGKLIKKIKKTTDGESGLKDLIEKLEELKEAFSSLEDKFKVEKENRPSIKKEYSDLRTKYDEIIAMIDQQGVMDGLKKAGAFSLVAAAITLGYFGVVTNGAIANNAILGKEGDVLGQGYEGSKQVVTKLLNKEKMINFADKASKLAKETKGELSKDHFLDAFGRKKALSYTYDESLKVSTLLNTAGAINGAVYGAGTVATVGIVALFKKLGNMLTNKNKLYYRTRSILDKMNNAEKNT